jgi:hypothetical protein
MWTVDQMGSWGDNPYNTASVGDTPDIDYTKFFGGTSGAAPQVAAIAAMIISRRSDLYTDNRYRDSLPQMIRHIIEASADDKGAPGFDIHYGWGRVNAYHALCNCPHQGDVDTVNSPGQVDMYDVLQEIEIAFSGGLDITDPLCPRSRGDVNNDQVADTFDVIQIIAIVFSGGSACDPCTPGVPPGCP